MKTKLTKITFATVALLFIAAAQTSLIAQNKEEQDALPQSANRIVGAWETTVTPTNCETGEQIAPAFPA